MLASLRRSGVTTVGKYLSSAVSRSLESKGAVAVGNVYAARLLNTQQYSQPKEDLLALREKPESLSYFTGNYKYNDFLIELDALYKQYADWKGAKEATVNTVEPDSALNTETVPEATYSWKLRDKMSQTLQIPLKTSQWRKIILHLNALASLPKPLPQPVIRVLQKYERFDSTQQATVKSKTLDELGRAYAVGRRKESIARCWVVEGEGKIMINGTELSSYFQRPSDCDQVTLPLTATENLEKYNVWAVVNGGGSSGQSQAIKLGIGKALLVHNDELKPILRQAGCITRDPRVVERKKEGQRKARAKYTWVKR
ncbi:37S ribosomal protein S9, mitochondrial [Apophysomyces ossiformis]|uniref:Small ribosomal subunit protein uS9m n=1 Tax=Apophysomyces ossiformis TaxID=679940 RepID=A0A8H7BM66_9FUNG|nr:37S ribosomal protein S9, mitochondrial [Apophysomyces ossiformis]